MNNDLISRKYVIKELLKEREHFPAMVAERYSLGVKLPHQFNQAMRGGIRKGLRIVETAPAVDAEPVRHGRWEKVQVWKDNPQTTLKCSICKTCQPIYEHDDWLYCPFCVAKMDMEVSNHEEP